MKTKFTLLFVLFFAFNGIFAQNNFIKLISSQQDETVLTFNFNSYRFNSVQTENGESAVITADDLSSLMIKDAPDLPKYTKSLIIPDADEMKIEIISSKFKDLDGAYNVAPSKGNLLRTVDPSSIPYHYGKFYKSNSFFPGKIAELGNPYIIRDYRGESVIFYPVQYNPVTKKIRIYSEITVKISPAGKRGKNILIRTHNNNTVSKEFGNIYKNHFLNYNQTAKYTPLEEEGNMLIICYDDWTSAMQAFVDWKNKIGRHTEMVTVTEAGGTAANIKTYVENYYNTNGLTYLLLVGDAAQVPTNSGSGLGGDSDNAYGFISGNDHYQEIFVGRFSAESEADVTTQVQRTLTYEDGSSLASDWLNRTIGIASAQGDGQGDDGESDFVHTRNMQADLIGFTYVEPTYELFDGSQGGNDAAGDPTPADVATDINSGGGIITYCGHGADTYWDTSGFSVSDVNNLTNDNKLPFIFDVACVNGNFVGQTCFGESWLRAQNNGNPTGAIAICASTINQSWAPPMIAEDEMVDLLVGASVNGTKRTFTGLVVNGMFQMLDESSDNDMADTWTTFGDPSLMVRTDNPANMTVSHDAVLIMGSSNFTVNCDFDGALACVSRNGEIIGTAYVSGGTASVPISGVTPDETLDVVVTGFNKITYQGQTVVTAPSGPYIVLDSYDLSGNHSIDFGQTDNINITLKNVGQDDASGVTATLSTSDANVTTMNNNTNISFGNITGNNGTATVSGQFEITVSDNAEDQHVIPFTLNITDGTDTWESNFNVIINAPAISIGNVFITNDDNSDGRLDPGETGDINFTVTNSGHADADFSGTLSEASDPNNYLTLGGTTVAPVAIAASGSQDFTFTGASADINTPLESTVGLQLDVAAGASNQYTETSNQDIIIGIVPIYPISDGGTLTVCTGTFYDSGLDTDDYQNSEDYTMTFMPPAGEDFVVVDFTSFDLENNYDYLHVYDGQDTNAPEISGSPFTGTTSPGTLMGANGLTFNFTSDGLTTHSGWVAEVSCYTPTTPPDCPTNPVPADAATNVFPVKLTWDASLGATSYDVYFGTDTDPYSNAPVTVTSPVYYISASPNTTYYWAVLPANSVGTGSGCDVWSFTTGDAQYIMTDGATVTTCDGVFYDEGGPDNDYSNSLDQTMTFMPGTSGKMISADFTSFDTESGYDDLKIYDGTDASATLIGSYDGTNSPGTVTATNPDGALTFVFHSDGSITHPGWSANISCVDPPATYTVTFNVSDGTNPIEGANVTFNGLSINTDASGLAVFNNVEEGTGLTYSVTKTGYYDANGTVDADADKTVDVVMNIIPTYTVTFNVSDGTNPIEGANVNFDGRDIATDASGVAEFDNCPNNSGMAYTVTKTGYQDASGSVDVTGNMSVNVTMNATVGINDMNKSFNIIPNPNNGLFTIKTKGLNTTNSTVEIYSVSGKLIYQNKINSDVMSIDLSGNAKGIYFLKINSGNRVFNSKLVIK